MANVRLGFSARGLGSTTRQVGRLSRAITGMNKLGMTGSRALVGGFGRLRSTFSGVSGALGGLGVALGARQVLQFDDALGALQAAARLPTEQMQKMREEILNTQSALGLNKDQIVAGLQVFQDQGGILDKNRASFAALAKRAKATGTDFADLAQISAALQNNLGLDPSEAIGAIDTLIKQGDEGTIAMNQMARELKPIAGLAASAGQDILKLGAAFQTIGAVAKSPETARDQLDALLASLKKNGKTLSKKGFKIFTKDATGKQVLRDFDDILRQIFIKSKGKLTGKFGLNEIFKEENASRAASALFAQFDRSSGQFKSGGTFGRIAGVKGSEKDIDARLNLLTTGIAAESERIKKAGYKLEATFQRLSKQFLGFAAANPLKAGIGAGSALVGAQVGSQLLSASLMGQFNGKLAGAVRGLGALAAAYVAAEIATTGLGEAFLYVQKKLNERELAKHTAGVNANQLALVANQLAALKARNANATVTNAQGETTALNREGIAAILTANAKRLEISNEKLAAVLPGLIAAAIEGRPVQVTVNSAGVDKPQTVLARSPRY